VVRLAEIGTAIVVDLRLHAKKEDGGMTLVEFDL
jgi:hypothetical protein